MKRFLYDKNKREINHNITIEFIFKTMKFTTTSLFIVVFALFIFTIQLQLNFN